jgi:hypothetical protein
MGRPDLTPNVEGCNEASAPHFRRRGSAPATIGQCDRQGRVGGTGARRIGTPRRHGGAVRGRTQGAAAPPARPQGQILPSLADVEPIAGRLEEAAASPRRKRDGLAAPGKFKMRRKKDPGRRIAPSALAFEASREETRTVAPRAGAERTAAAPSRAAPAKRKVAQAEPRATHAVAAAKPAAIPEAPLENAAADRAGARQARHRRILERYVLGTELKPGERWKRRLQKTR